MNLHQKLVEVRKSLPYFQKEAQGHHYKYVKGSQILATIQSKINELGILIYPVIPKYEIDIIDNGKKDKNGIKINDFVLKSVDAYLQIVDAESGESIGIPFVFTGMQEDPSRAFGSALTYSERYFLMKFFNIPTDEDDPDKWDEKQDLRNENLSDKIAELMSKIVGGGMLHESEVEPLENEIKKSVSDSQKKSLIKYLESKISDFAKNFESEKKVKDLQQKIIKGLDLMEYEDTHRNNSILKHLGDNQVLDCKDLNLLTRYYNYLVEQYKKKQKEF